MDVIQYLIERFYSQYIILRDFYVNAAAIRSVTTIIAVPNLPVDPPQVCWFWLRLRGVACRALYPDINDISSLPFQQIANLDNLNLAKLAILP